MTFKYEAMNAAGQNVDGNLEAESSEDAVAKIRSQGLFPIRVRRLPCEFKDLPVKFRDPSGSGLIDLNMDEPMSEADRRLAEVDRLLARAKRMNTVSVILLGIAILALFLGTISAIK